MLQHDDNDSGEEVQTCLWQLFCIVKKQPVISSGVFLTCIPSLFYNEVVLCGR